MLRWWRIPLWYQSSFGGLRRWRDITIEMLEVQAKMLFVAAEKPLRQVTPKSAKKSQLRSGHLSIFPSTLQETNISPQKWHIWVDDFPNFLRWDMSIPWRLPFCFSKSPQLLPAPQDMAAKWSFWRSFLRHFWVPGEGKKPPCLTLADSGSHSIFFLHHGFGKGRTAGIWKNTNKTGMMIRIFVFCCCRLWWFGLKKNYLVVNANGMPSETFWSC